MKKYITLFVTALLAISLNTGCGVIFGGSKFTGKIFVKDNPNVNIYYEGQKIGTGRATYRFPRNEQLVLEVQQEGCEIQGSTFDRDFRTGNFILSVITWFIPGIAVDLLTGASYRPDYISDARIQRWSVKNYIFTVEYTGCER